MILLLFRLPKQVLNVGDASSRDSNTGYVIPPHSLGYKKANPWISLCARKTKEGKINVALLFFLHWLNDWPRQDRLLFWSTHLREEVQKKGWRREKKNRYNAGVQQDIFKKMLLEKTPSTCFVVDLQKFYRIFFSVASKHVRFWKKVWQTYFF